MGGYHVQPVNPDSREVLHVKGDERAAQPGAHIAHLLVLDHVLELNGEPVRSELVVPGDRVHADTYQRFEWREDHLEKEERNHGRRLGGDRLGKVERAQKRWGMQERGEQREDGEGVHLRDDHLLQGVVVVPVAKFMSEDGLDLLGLGLLDERVKDDNVFALMTRVNGSYAKLKSDIHSPTAGQRNRHCCASCAWSHQFRISA